MGQVVLVTGVSRYLGGRMAQILTQDPGVDRVIGVDVVAPRPAEPLWLAWSADDEGEALKWWRARLQAPDALAAP